MCVHVCGPLPPSKLTFPTGTTVHQPKNRLATPFKGGDRRSSLYYTTTTTNTHTVLSQKIRENTKIAMYKNITQHENNMDTTLVYQ